MEKERKRKRAEKGEAASDTTTDDSLRRNKKAVEVNLEKKAAPPPSEEEVEEFFAILKRMKMAAKYLEKGGESRGGRQRNPTAAAETAGDGSGKRAERSGGLLDLNAIPEGEAGREY